MPEILSLVLVASPLMLMIAVLIPSASANRAARRFRVLVTGIAGLQFLVAILMAAAFAGGAMPTLTANWQPLEAAPGVALSTYYDGPVSADAGLVSFVGWVDLSILDPLSRRGLNSRVIISAGSGFTIGAVSLLVISGNLLMFFACWMLTSLGLHRLLLHYGHRPAAQRAAWTKFVISRLGDAALLGSIVAIYHEFGTLQFAELFSAAAAHSRGSLAGHDRCRLSCWSPAR